MSIQLRDGFKGEPLNRVLEDLLVRFVINAPVEDLSTNARVFFLFEEAHWFYLDFCRIINPSLQSLKMRSFSKMLIDLFPLIWLGGDPEEGLKEFSSYKQSIPVRGAALFDEQLDKILLVQGTESSSWSFPRGKISKDELDSACAVREVKEEIGFDISPYINEEDYIERTMKGKNYRIYLCKNIPDDFPFKPLARNEINSIRWEDFKKLPKKVKNQPSKYFLVSGMIRPLINYVRKHKDEYQDTQRMLEVENHLKALLGVDQEEQPVNDPGRELLDFIRQSAAKKQALDQQALPHQQPAMHIPPQMPMYPMPAFGFQPPPFHQFMPFAPPPMGGMPLQFTGFGINPMMFQGPAIPFRPAQIQQPPSTDQLQRPSLNLRNDEESKELLSLLNSKKDDKPSKDKNFMSQLLSKNESTGAKKISLLKRDGDGKQTESDKHKNGLLALLHKPIKKTESPEEEQKEEPPLSQSSDASAELMSLLHVKKTEPPALHRAAEPAVNDEERPKMKLLKRGDRETPTKTEVPTRSQSPKVVKPDISKRVQISKNEKSNKTEKTTKATESNSPKNNNSSIEDLNLQPAPPTKELLDLIRASKEIDDDVEIFEDFSDEEFDEDFGQQSDDQYEEKLEEEYEQHLEDEKSPEVEDIPAPHVFATTPAKPKMRLLKRGETLDDLVSTSEARKSETTEASREAHHDVASVSTIQFSDDDEDEEEEDLEASRETVDRDDTTPAPGVVTAEYLEAAQAEVSYNPPPSTSKNRLLSALLQRTASPVPEQESKAHDGAELLNLLHKDPIRPSSTQGAVPSTNAAGSELLGMLHKPQTPATPHENTTAKNDLLGLLHKSSTPSTTATPDPRAEIMGLLHKEPTPTLAEAAPSSPVPAQSSNASTDLLSLLHKKPEQATSRAQSPSTQHSNGSPANDLLSLLHKTPSAPASPVAPVDLPQEQPEPERKESASNSLMNLLFRR